MRLLRIFSGAARAPAKPGRTTAGSAEALPPYPTAAVLSSLVLSVVGSAAPGAPFTVQYVVCLVGLSVGLGAGLGVLLQLVFGALRRAPRFVPALLWTALSFAAALWLADALGTFGRLGTRYDAIARATLGVCAAQGALGAVLLSLVQPRRTRPRGWLGGRGRAMRGVASVGLLLVTAALGHADHTLYVGLYPAGHSALRSWAFLTTTVALVLVADELRLPRMTRRDAAVVVCLFAIPVLWLREDDVDTVQAFAGRPWPATVLRCARMVVDLDRDGFSAALAGGDCNDLDPHVYPTATEIPENGIDDNCVFGDLVLKRERYEHVATPTTPSPMNVVLITIDAWRWDRLGINSPRFGGAGLNVTPKLDRWASKAVNFRHAYTAGAWTSIALGSFMRGVYARRLTWTAYFETNFYRLLRKPFEGLLEGERIAKMFPISWHDPRPTLAGWLKRRGMSTTAVVDDGFSQMLSPRIGASHGFGTYREINLEPRDGKAFEKNRKRRRVNDYIRNDATTATFAISQLRVTARRNKPFFFWVHFFGPHTPDQRRSGIPKYAPTPQGRYNHEVRYVDLHVGRLLDEIDRQETPTAVFVTADHGEKFYTRYRSHGADLDEDVIRVPLLARVPGWKPGNVEVPVSLVDLMPTILSLTQTPAPAGLDGIDLAPLVKGAPGPSRLLLSDTWQYGRDGEAFRDLIAAFDGTRKVVLRRNEHSFSAYDQRHPKSPEVRIDPTAVDRFSRRILGYLEESGGALRLED